MTDSYIQHRAKFRPNLYHRPVPEKASAPKTAPQQPASPIVASPTSMKSPASMTTSESTQPLQSSSVHNRQIRPRGRAAKFQPFPQVHPKKSLNKMFRARNKGLPKQRELTAFNDPSECSDDSVGETDVLEVWFAGCHSGRSFYITPSRVLAQTVRHIAQTWAVEQRRTRRRTA